MYKGQYFRSTIRSFENNNGRYNNNGIIK